MAEQKMSKTHGYIDGWNRISEISRTSDISNFKGGVEKDSIEILIWEGVMTVDDTVAGGGSSKWEEIVVLEGHTDSNIPEWANYIIEVKEDGELLKEKFAETKVGAWTKTERLAENYD